ncbi:hypothetical protein NQD34_001747 [Periophthalmus magnuspinnatus]|nr:hypothetical protein NQD34_001747 [Periophthalmus magnuspinnatus]
MTSGPVLPRDRSGASSQPCPGTEITQATLSPAARLLIVAWPLGTAGLTVRALSRYRRGILGWTQRLWSRCGKEGPSHSTDLPSAPPLNKAWVPVIILGRWRQGQPVKGAGVTPEERMVGMTEKKKRIVEKIKSRSSPFTPPESSKEDKERSGPGSPVLSGN